MQSSHGNLAVTGFQDEESGETCVLYYLVIADLLQIRSYMEAMITMARPDVSGAEACWVFLYQ